jgi:uncharacterized protein (DUF2236 family)
MDPAPPPRGSIAWRYASDARTLMGAGAALVLQVAHPTVAAGVREHSNFQQDPWGRLLRTLDHVNLLLYGGPEAARATGARLREMHKRIKGVAPDGRRYHALEPEAYAWVHATLAWVIVDAHRQFGRRMRPDQAERFYAEWRALGGLLRVRERDLPPTWAEFGAYVERMVDERLEDSDVVQTVLRTLTAPSQPPAPWLPDGAWRMLRLPAARTLQLTTIALVPAALRARVGLRLGERDRLELAVLGAVSRRATPVMPASLRRTGPGWLQWRHDAIEREHGLHVAA